MPSESKKAASKPAAREVTGPEADPRQARLAQALRANLKKRKAQQRQRAGGAEGERGGKGGSSSGGGT